MEDSTTRDKFLANDPSIDCNGITVPARDVSNGWGLALPLTTIFSKMYLNRPRQVQSSAPNSDEYLSKRELGRLAKSCRATSKELQERLSISSDTSDPGMMYDPFNSSDSDTSFDEPFTRNPSAADLAALQEENETWDLYWTPAKDALQSRIDQCRSPLGTRDPNLSLCNRNLASSNLPTLIPECSRDLQRPDAIRGPRRPTLLSQTNAPLLPRTTYSPLQAPTSTSSTHHSHSQTQPRLHPTDPQHTQHKSWPARTSSTQAPKTHSPLRTRAHTTPGTPSKFTPNYPSNLSTCTTLDYHSPPPSTSSTLYMRSAPSSPACVNETSWFEFDDEEEEKGLVGSLREKLHIRSASSQERGGDGEGNRSLGVEVRRGKKRTRRSLSEVMKGVFRARKKGGTL